MICGNGACRRVFGRERSWPRVERGAVIDGRTVLTDEDYCCDECLAARYGVTTANYRPINGST